MENLLLLGLVISTTSSILEVSLDPCLKGFNLPRVLDTEEKKVGLLEPPLEDDDDVVPME